MFNDEKELDEKYIHFLNITLWWTQTPTPQKKKTNKKHPNKTVNQKDCELIKIKICWLEY